LQLPTSKYAFASTLEELQSGADAVGYPCFVKPVMSSSGKGQSRIKDASGVAKAWEYALSGGRVKQPRVIVESEIRFDFEITLLTVRHAGGTSFCDPIGHVQVDGDYVESWQPQAMSTKALEASRLAAKKVTDALGGLGIFGVELFVSGDDIWFSEVSPRPHDTGLVTLVSQHLSEFALHARAILGLPVDTSLRTPGASAVIYGGMEAKGIAFEGVDEALKVPGAEIRLFGKPEAFRKRRMGVALARADDTDTARAQAKRAAAAVKPVR
jgi:phosphoribosylglycinamide formyltransferase 2